MWISALLEVKALKHVVLFKVLVFPSIIYQKSLKFLQPIMFFFLYYKSFMQKAGDTGDKWKMVAWTI